MRGYGIRRKMHHARDKSFDLSLLPKVAVVVVVILLSVSVVRIVVRNPSLLFDGYPVVEPESITYCEVGEWSDWSSCNPAGGQNRIRTVNESGVACPPDLIQFQSCVLYFNESSITNLEYDDSIADTVRVYGSKFERRVVIGWDTNDHYTETNGTYSTILVTLEFYEECWCPEFLIASIRYVNLLAWVSVNFSLNSAMLQVRCDSNVMSMTFQSISALDKKAFIQPGSISYISKC